MIDRLPNVLQAPQARAPRFAHVFALETLRQPGDTQRLVVVVAFVQRAAYLCRGALDHFDLLGLVVKGRGGLDFVLVTIGDGGVVVRLAFLVIVSIYFALQFALFAFVVLAVVPYGQLLLDKRARADATRVVRVAVHCVVELGGHVEFLD